MYLLDTDHVVILQRGATAERLALAKRMETNSAANFFISIVTFHEQVAGWQAFLNSKRSTQQVVRGYHELGRILQAFAEVQLAEFDQQAAELFDELRRQRVRIGTMDLRIASIALFNDYTVLSRNLVDFQKVPGLRIEDWTTPIIEKPR